MGLLSYQVRRTQPNSSAVYVRHRPETTLLYQIIREYWPEFQAELASQKNEKAPSPLQADEAFYIQSAKSRLHLR
jgi:hypothetical protein